MQPAYIDDTDRKVKDALDIWAEWYRQGANHSMGYGRPTGFDGASNVSGWDDFERKVDRNMAINVQALYEGLTQPLQLAIDHFHLSSVWRSNRGTLESDYENAITQITMGLRRRLLI